MKFLRCLKVSCTITLERDYNGCVCVSVCSAVCDAPDEKYVLFLFSVHSANFLCAIWLSLDNNIGKGV